MRDITKMVVVLFGACGLAAGSLAVVNAVTKKAIEDQKTQKTNEGLRKVFADADDFAPVTPDKEWEALRKKEKVGRVFQTVTPGYGGPVTLMFGRDAGGVVTGLRVLDQTETPGLGTRVATPEFTDQFKGKRAEQIALKKDGGQIDGITGATISSRAVTSAVRATMDSFDKAQKAGGDK